MKSQQFFRVLFAAATILGLGSLGNPTLAVQDTDMFQVTATVQSVCTITASDLAFGSYDPSAGDRDATSTLDVTCTNGTIYTVGLNGGGTGVVTARAMAGPGGATLNYAMFRDSSRTQNWEDIGSLQVESGTGNGATQPLTVYGRVAGGQFSTGGSYSDTVTATIDF